VGYCLARCAINCLSAFSRVLRAGRSCDDVGTATVVVSIIWGLEADTANTEIVGVWSGYGSRARAYGVVQGHSPLILNLIYTRSSVLAAFCT